MSSDSSTIIAIAQSLISSGFHLEETMVSRGYCQGFRKLCFADGSKRGLACKLVPPGCYLQPCFALLQLVA